MADYYKNDDDKIVNTEPTPLNPSPAVLVVENEATGELAPSPKTVADEFVDGEHNKDKKVVGQAPIHFPIPPVKDMTYTDLVNVIKANAPELSTEEIMDMLVGKYVRIMEAPTSTTLTDEQIAQITAGVFINGDFLSRKNPILCPTNETNDAYFGLMISGPTSQYSNHTIALYKITKATKVIESVFVGITLTGNSQLSLTSLKNVNNKAIPNYPSNTGTFGFKCVDGTLAWQQEWYGTQTEYDNLGTYDSNTTYYILESSNS